MNRKYPEHPMRSGYCERACEGIGTGEVKAIIDGGSTLKAKFEEVVAQRETAQSDAVILNKILNIVRAKIATECCGTIMDKSSVVSMIDEFVNSHTLPHMRRVVCAANRYGDDLLLLGARHWDKQMHAMADKIGFKRADYEREEQGFIDQYGVFMTRQEAWAVAKAAGQIIRRCGGDEGCLYSENLY